MPAVFFTFTLKHFNGKKFKRDSNDDDGVENFELGL